jgi:hypothetical protein
MFSTVRSMMRNVLDNRKVSAFFATLVLHFRQQPVPKFIITGTVKIYSEVDYQGAAGNALTSRNTPGRACCGRRPTLPHPGGDAPIPNVCRCIEQL